MFLHATDLADAFRHLLQVVKGALGGERRRGLFSGPLALLTWMRTRREHKEREEALQQFKALLEEFLALLADFRAGKLAADMTPPVYDAQPKAPQVRQSGPSWRRIVETWPLLRFSELYAASGVGQERPSLRPTGSILGSSPRTVAGLPQSAEGEGAPVRAARRSLRCKLAHAFRAAEPWIPACAGMTSWLFARARAGPARHEGELQNRC
jgi:hypothetical protein